MATLTHDAEYPCSFDLNLLQWERYTSKEDDSEVRTVHLGAPYTLWVKYRMALRIGDRVLYQGTKETTLVLEDIKGLLEELREIARGINHKTAFDPMEPDFGLVIRRLTESDASVMISSAAKIRGEEPTDAANRSSAPSDVFDVNVWIDYTNQVDHFYSGYGPGLYFSAEARDIERFASELEMELNALGPYSTG